MQIFALVIILILKSTSSSAAVTSDFASCSHADSASLSALAERLFIATHSEDSISLAEWNRRLCTFAERGGIVMVDILQNLNDLDSRDGTSFLRNILIDEKVVNGEFSENTLDLAILVEPDIRVRSTWSRFKSFGEPALSLGLSLRRIKISDFDVYERIINIVAQAGDGPLRHLLYGITAIGTAINTNPALPFELEESSALLFQNIRELLLMSVLHRDILSLRNLVALPRNLRDIQYHLPAAWNQTIAPLVPDLALFVSHCIEDDEESLTPVLEFLETVHTIAERGRLTGWSPADPSVETLFHRNLNEWVRQSIQIDPSSNIADSFARWTPIDFLNGAGLGNAMDYIRPRDIDVYDFLLQATHPNVRGWDDEEIIGTVFEFFNKISQIEISTDFVIPNVYDAFTTDPTDLAIAYIRTGLFWGILHGHFDFKDLVSIAFLRKSYCDMISSRMTNDSRDLFDEVLHAMGEYARLFLVEEYLPVTPIVSLLKNFDKFLIDDQSELSRHVSQLSDSISVYVERSGIHLGPISLSPVGHHRHQLGPEVLPLGINNMYEHYLLDMSMPVFAVSPHTDLVAVSTHQIAHMEFIPFAIGRFLRLILSDNTTVIHDLNHEHSVALVSSTLRIYPTERVAIDYDEDRVVFWFPSYRLPRELFLAQEEYIVTGFTDPIFEYERGFTIVVVTKCMRTGTHYGTTMHVSSYGSAYAMKEFELPLNFERVQLAGNGVYVNGEFFCEAVSAPRRGDQYILAERRDRQAAFLRRFHIVGDQIFSDQELLVSLGARIIEPLTLLVEDKYAVLVVKTEDASTVLVDVETKWSPKTGFSP